MAQSAAEQGAHDAGVYEVSALSARLAYAMMCLTVCWGALTSMGWVGRVTGRQALRSGHIFLSATTLAFIAAHSLSYLMLQADPYTMTRLLIPFYAGGPLYTGLGILAFECLLVVVIATGMRRFMSNQRWLFVHRLAYVAFVLGILHALLTAMANGHVAILWLGGITLLIPTLAVIAVRVMPAKALATTGLIEDAP
ncbi:MAG TPA: ferric reductase-like transmembrane domain-containing protein [Actinophytocola sp.]|uniref:ferric reductase-like transmembrane domain-containing protein n=1 Tax=Actinophytocola sp. TaxID=1872138 RepID=UPI002DB82D55|nr:ferric reductase-like transmembrane domain-containing protein [Actinophytocola sp.]HEU5471509.1 ferric reductase-like transmembrane domain-containing protein [Actinophytocola sp.]